MKNILKINYTIITSFYDVSEGSIILPGINVLKQLFLLDLSQRIQFIVNENWPKASALGERFQGKSNTSISSPCTGLVLARTKRISTQGFKNYLVYPPFSEPQLSTDNGYFASLHHPALSSLPPSFLLQHHHHHNHRFHFFLPQTTTSTATRTHQFFLYPPSQITQSHPRPNPHPNPHPRPHNS
jgi:hypothetical protein